MNKQVKLEEIINALEIQNGSVSTSKCPGE